MIEIKYLNNLNKGIYALKKGNYGYSINICDNLIKSDKNLIDAYYYKGIAY